MVCSLRWHRKNGGRVFSLPPLRLCCVDQFAIHNLHSPASDIIHPADPLHLVVCLELFRDTFRLGHLLYQPKEHFLRLTVDVGKIGVQSATGNYPKYDETSGYVKVPSQQLSDALVEAFKGRLKND